MSMKQTAIASLLGVFCLLSQKAFAENVHGTPALDSAASWPRVFYSAKQRDDIERRRLPPDLRQAAEAPTIDPNGLPPPVFTLDGIARGHLGASAIINGVWYRPGDKIFNWIVKIETNQVILTGLDVPILRMKPGQTVRIDNGAVMESVPSRSLKLGAALPAASKAKP